MSVHPGTADTPVPSLLGDDFDAPSWISWEGGARPVEPDTFVMVEDRVGNIMGPFRADEWLWNHAGNDKDIVTFKVYPTPHVTADDIQGDIFFIEAALSTYGGSGVQADVDAAWARLKRALADGPKGQDGQLRDEPQNGEAA
jgi:hypothetical protein